LLLISGSSEQARVLFKAGKARDGYFQNDDLVDQATKAMDILEKHYPHDKHVFVYDNAKTHAKRPPNARSARKMTLNSSAKFKVEMGKDSNGTPVMGNMRDGIFPDGSAQSLYFPSDHPTRPGYFKGMKILIQERREKGANLPDPQKLKAQCKGFRCEPGQRGCCCRRIMFTEPDFVNQKSILQEHCARRGVNVLYFPKFHCELNPIEQCWGYAKRYYRELPITSSEKDLENNVLKSLEMIPLHCIRR
jgi:hypothetical protein